MPRTNESTDGRGEGIPPIPPEESRAPEVDLSRVAVEDLMGELHDRGFGFIAVRLDEGEPEPAEAPAVESIYTEVLTQELERRGWECFPPD